MDKVQYITDTGNGLTAEALVLLEKKHVALAEKMSDEQIDAAQRRADEKLGIARPIEI